MTNESQDAVVYVVDDEPEMRSALVRLFRSAGLQVHAFASGAECINYLKPHMAGCLVLDFMMAGLNGREIQDRLRVRGIGMPLIFLTGSASIHIAVEAMHAGAQDFLEKPYDNAALVERVRRALQIRSEVRHGEAARLDVRRRLATLTPLEREVMDLATAGHHTRGIAEMLSLSTQAVETHRSHIMEKMNAKSLADLVRLAVLAPN